MQHAVIIGGVVAAKVEWDAKAHPDYTYPLPHDALVLCPAGARIGDLYDADTGTFTTPKQEEPFAEATASEGTEEQPT